MTEPANRSYRFAPLDRTGALLGLSAAQCVLLGGGIFTAGGLLQAGAHPAVVLLPLLAAAILALGAWDGQRAVELLPRLARHHALAVTGRHRWRAPLPLLSARASDESRQPELPPFLAGIELLDGGPVPWTGTGHGVGVVADRRERTLSASLPVGGREFSLVERADQERIVARWGDVLGGFCTERGPVSRIRVTEWAAPAGHGEHHRFLAAHGATWDPAARAAYEQLLDQAGPSAVRPEILLTVTVEERKVRRRRHDPENRHPETVAIAALLEEVRLLVARLEAAGLTAGPPLSVRATATALRHRLDPLSAARPPSTLAEATGLTSRCNAGPLAVEADWGHLRVDGSFHRAYWIAEWPRLEVGPNWLEPVLLHAGGTRTFALHYEPVAPSRSQRRIDRDSTRLAADEEQRRRNGFRIGAQHRRAQSAVLDREAELVAGHHELEYAGFLIVTASNLDTLERSCAEHEQTAAQAGLDLRPLHGRQDLALACALPVGRGIAPRRVLT